MLFATISRCASRQMGVSNLIALHFQSLTPVSSSLPSADCLGLSAVRVHMPMLLLAGRGVLLCSTLGRPVLSSAVHIGVYVVLHLLCGDWPSLWFIGLMMFLWVSAWQSWLLMLPLHSIASGHSYCYVLMPLVLFPDCRLITILLSHSIVCPIPNSEALRPGNRVTVSSHSDTHPVWSLVCYGLTID